jgi:hypothetical protein
MRFINLLLVLAILTACQAQPTSPTAAPTLPVAPQTRVRVEPATLSLQAGQKAAVSAQIENVKDLVGVQLRIAYNPVILDVQDADAATDGIQVTPGNFLTPDFVAENAVYSGTINTTYLQLPPRQAITGTGQLIAFTVTALAAGETPLSLNTVNLADSKGQPIPARLENGQVTVKP